MTDLAVTEEQALAVMQGYIPVEGLDDLAPEEFSLPRLVLVQSQHVHDEAEQHRGQYYRTDVGEHLEKPKMLIIGIAKSRVLFEEGFSRDSKPICRSDNGIAPRDEYIGTKHQGQMINSQCFDCPFSQWGDGNTKPLCTLSDNWAALLDDGSPVVFRMSGMAAKASKQIKMIARTSKARKRPLTILLSSNYITDDKGAYYTPVVKSLQEEMPPEVLEIAKEFMGINLAGFAAKADDMEGTNGDGDFPEQPADNDLYDEDVPF